MPEKKPFPHVKPTSKANQLHPREDDAALWDIVTKDVTRLRQKHAVPAKSAELVKSVKKPVKTSEPKGRALSKDVHGWIMLETTLPPPAHLHKPAKSSHQVDAGLKKKFLQGDLPIDGKIDLHGLSLEQAHRRFMAFLSSKIGQGARFLLVVTGKGTGGEGVIRKSFSHWCEESRHAASILLIHHAAAKHGGSGAFYILLRRAK